MSVAIASSGAIAYSAANGTSVSPAYPASIAAGDLLVLVIGMKPTTAGLGTITIPTGWNYLVAQSSSFGTALGADTGDTEIWILTKIATGSETGSLAVTVSNNNVCWGVISRLTKAAGTSWGIADLDAGDYNGSTGSAPVGSGKTVFYYPQNYLAFFGICIPTDVTTPAQFTEPSYTSTTVGSPTVTLTEVGEPDSNTGNDIGGVVFGRRVDFTAAGSSIKISAHYVSASGTITNVKGPWAGISVYEATDFSNLTDDFSTKDTIKWIWGSTSGVSAGLASVSSNEVVYSALGYSLIGSSVYFDMVDSGNKYVYLAATDTTVPALIGRALVFSISAGVLKAGYLNSSGGFVSSATVSYSSATRYCRIREASGTVYWEYSGDGSSWTTLYSQTTSTISTQWGGVPVLSFRAFLWANSGAASFGGVNILDTGGLTAIGANSQLVWKTAQAVGDTSSLSWNTRGAVFDTTTLRYATEVTVGDTSDVRWAVKTALGETSTLRWNTRFALGDTSQLVWNTIAPVTAIGKDSILRWAVRTVLGDTSSLLWNVRFAFGDPTVLRWNTRAALGDTSVLRWNTRTLAFDSSDLRWAVRTTLGDQSDLRWAVRATLGDTSVLRWNTRALAFDSSDLRWNTRATAFDSSDVRWAVRTTLGDSSILNWNVRAAIGDSSALVWNVLTLAGAIGKNSFLLWNTRAALGDTSSLSWAVRAVLGDTSTIRYAVRAIGADQTDIRWNTRATAFDTSQLVWNVRTTIGDQSDVRWAVRTALGDTSVLRWNTRAAAFDTSTVRWNTRQAVSDVSDLRYAVRTLLGDTSVLRWAVKSTAGDNSILRWNTRGLVLDTTQLVWNVRATAYDESQIIWNVYVGIPISNVDVWGFRF